METLGVWLRQAREAKGTTVEEAAAATHIRPRLLAALEAGDFAAFSGGDVQVRGFLRIYARYTGLAPDEVLARYDAEIHGLEVVRPGTPVATRPAPPAQPGVPVATRPAPSTQLGVPVAARPASPTRPMAAPAALQPPRFSASTPRPRRMSLEGLMVAALVLAALLALVAGMGYVMSRRAGEETVRPAVATATVPAAAGLPSATSAIPTPSAVVSVATSVAPPTLPANPQGGVALALEATEHVWARVTADGQTVFAGMLATGQVETWPAREVIVVDTGNGAGLLVTVNGQPQGAMCGRAQVCTRGWGPSGEISAP